MDDDDDECPECGNEIMQCWCNTDYWLKKPLGSDERQSSAIIAKQAWRMAELEEEIERLRRAWKESDERALYTYDVFKEQRKLRDAVLNDDDREEIKPGDERYYHP